jgi:hypothetical protein
MMIRMVMGRLTAESRCWWQSLYPYESLLYALMDKTTVMECKVCIARYFYFAVIEVSANCHSPRLLGP